MSLSRFSRALEEGALEYRAGDPAMTQEDPTMNEYYVEINDGDSKQGSGWRQLSLRHPSVHDITEQECHFLPSAATLVRVVEESPSREIREIVRGRSDYLESVIAESTIPREYFARPTYYPE